MNLIAVVQQVVQIQIQFALMFVAILGPIAIAPMAMCSGQMGIVSFKRNVHVQHVS